MGVVSSLKTKKPQQHDLEERDREKEDLSVWLILARQHGLVEGQIHTLDDPEVSRNPVAHRKLDNVARDEVSGSSQGDVVVTHAVAGVRNKLVEGLEGFF